MTEDDLGLGALKNLRHRPALDALKREQVELQRDALNGLHDRREVLLWLQRVSVRTFGRLPDEWFAWIGTTRHITAALITDAETRNGMVGEDVEMPQAAAEAWREVLVEQHVEPACASALAFLNTQASQYETSGTSGDLPDPDRQNSPGMRPVLKDIERQQRDVLDAMLAGFDSLDDVRAWVSELRSATEQALPAGYQSLATKNAFYRSALLGGEDRFHTRATIAAATLLPLMNQAARTAASSANEYIDESRTKHTPTKGY